MGRTTNLRTSLVMAVFLMAMACTAAGKTILVDCNAPGPVYDGSSWPTAFKYLQDGLSAALSGDEIRVAGGIYKPDEDSAHPNGSSSRTATFRLKNGVAIKGGYAGFGQPEPDARDPNTHETILSGDLLGNDGPNFANNDENSYHVVTGSGTDATAFLEGFTITGGNANGSVYTQGFGGGMWYEYGSPTITNCTFGKNSAEWGGGGMCNLFGSPTLTNCTFNDNSASYGGGMSNREGNPTLTNCTFIHNLASEFGGGMNNRKGNPTLTNCTFTRNEAQIFGGGMLNNQSNPTVTNCTFSNNSAEFGGGMENESNSNFSLIGCIFKANSARIGGAIRNHTSSPTLLNCLIVANRALAGGGILNENSSNPTLINCTFSSNSATHRGGGINNNDNSPILNNCILWANSDENGVDESAQIHAGFPAVNYSCIQGWTGNLGGIGNINADPWFVEPGYLNAYGAWIDGDYHLRRGSPCINAGDNSAVPLSLSKDLDGNPRIAGGTVDMGAYEDYSAPVTIYVEANATGANNGSSWADAFNDLQDALAEAQLGDEIHVARGAYSPEGPLPDIRQASNPNPVDGSFGVSTNADLSWTAGPDATSHDVYFGTTKPPPFMQNQTATTFDPGKMAYYTTYYWRIDEVSNGSKTAGTIWSFTTLSAPPPPPPLGSSNVEESVEPAADRTATFQLKNGVVIKGGYAGFGGPDPNARDIEAYETILSGDLAANDEPNFVNYEDNSYHVVTGSGCNETAVLDGFTITAGYANGIGQPDNSGGGMYNTYGSPTVINCTFTKNAAGNAGAMANRYYCSPTLINCTFIGNAVTSSGAGMFDWISASTLINCDFRGNFGRYGAAMRIHNGSSTLTNCTFSGNFARQQGGALYVSYSTVELSNCSFSSNVTTLYYGGGIYDHQGSSSLFLTNCILFNNIDSGGMDESAQIHGGTPVVNYCCIQGWTGTWPGLGNTGADPMFARNPDDGGDGWGVGDTANFGALLSIGSNDDFGDLHLLPNSPCINAGDPDYVAEPNETDLDGRPRVIGGRIDMGAYEFNHIPVTNAGPDQTVQAQAPWGATVTLDGSGSSDADSTPGTIDDINDFNWYELDPCDPNADIFLGSGVIIDCNLAIGEHIIILEVIDRAGALDTDELNIIVQDTTPPDINCPPDVTLECPADTTPSATGEATATDTCGTVTITHSNHWQPSCGNAGALLRTWTATDESDNSASCVQIITVVDTTPPEFELSVSPTMLWPPDHKMVEITPSWTVSDKCDATPQVSIVSIVANEGDDTIGDGHTGNDIQIGEDGSIYLRSERSGTGKERIYTITYQAVDDCGNAAVRSATVSIPHDFKVLARIAAQWLWANRAGRIPEDLNGDGVVNFADFAKFAENWIK